jgi:phage-related protein
MATFDDATVGTSTNGTVPDFGLSKKSEPVVRNVQFGDGYSQRISFGLNQEPERIGSLTWTNRINADITAIETFFDARAGAESFTWNPPDGASSYKFIASSWNKQIDYAGVSTLSATFQQVFEP